jgi:hypothetical protein
MPARHGIWGGQGAELHLRHRRVDQVRTRLVQRAELADLGRANPTGEAAHCASWFAAWSP